MTCEDLGPYRRSGRPVSVICKRGHQHPARQKCVQCRSIRDAARYDKHREAKIMYQRQWRADFRLAFGKSYSFYYANGLRKEQLL